ncbi:MAG: hypothetical protein QM802_02120 [Agriterribacter sp.]
MKKFLLPFTSCIFLLCSITHFSCVKKYAVSKDEANRFAKQIETSLNNGNPGIFERAIYTPELISIIKEKSEKAKEFGFIQGFSRTFSLKGLGEKLITSIKNGSYTLIRSYEKEEKKHLLFRMFGDGGLNYHDLLLLKVKDSIKIADVYVYTQGEELSKTIADLIDDVDKSDNGSSNSGIKILTKFKRLRDRKDYAGIKKLYEGLQPDLKKNKGLAAIYIFACQELNQEDYVKALEQFSMNVPDASNAYLLMLDVYYVKKDIPKGLNVINKLDSLVGKDPFLDYYRGAFYLLEDNNKEAKSAFEKVFAYDPSIALNMQNLVMSCVKMQENDRAKAVIAGYKKTPDFKQSFIDEIYQEYPDLKE